MLSALSEPVRLQVVRDLASAQEPMACSAFVLPVTKATMTHHFRVLREAGVVEQRNVGNKRLNSLREHDLESRFPGLLAVVLNALA
ncbi:MAG: ArsR/SmtB family transcription factor [Phycicoccus sp.]